MAHEIGDSASSASTPVPSSELWRIIADSNQVRNWRSEILRLIH
jgi:hypothetical protein